MALGLFGVMEACVKSSPKPVLGTYFQVAVFNLCYSAEVSMRSIQDLLAVTIIATAGFPHHAGAGKCLSLRSSCPDSCICCALSFQTAVQSFLCPFILFFFFRIYHEKPDCIVQGIRELTLRMLCPTQFPTQWLVPSDPEHLKLHSEIRKIMTCEHNLSSQS